MKPLALAIAASLVASCATAGKESITPLRVLRASPAQLHVRPDGAGLADEALAARPGVGAPPTAAFRCRFYVAEPEWIERAVGRELVSAFALTSRSEDTQRLCRELEHLGAGTIPVPPIVEMRNGRRTTCSVITQIAYVSGYDVEIVPGVSAIADPRIAVARDGLVLAVERATPGGAARSFDLELTLCDLELADEDMSLFHGAGPVTVQSPRGETRTLRVASTFADGETMVLGGTGLAISGARGVLAVVEFLGEAEGTR